MDRAPRTMTGPSDGLTVHLVGVPSARVQEILDDADLRVHDHLADCRGLPVDHVVLVDLEGRGPPTAQQVEELPALVAVASGPRGEADLLARGFQDVLDPRLPDLERRLRLAVHRRALWERMRRRQQELDAFAAMAAHDLNAPLRTFGGFLDLLRRRLPSEARAGVEDHLGHLEQASRAMQDLVQDLLAYQVPTPPPACCDGAAVLDQVLERLAPRLEGAVVRTGRLPRLAMPAEALHDVLHHLLDNALTYCEGTPRIQVRAEAGPADARTGGVQSGAGNEDRSGGDAQTGAGEGRPVPGTEVRIVVEDNGLGVARALHDHLFTPLRRGQPISRYPGTGMGLAICRRLVAAYGGRIGLESPPEGGSRFWFTVHRAEAAPEPAQESVTENMRGQARPARPMDGRGDDLTAGS